MKCARAITFAVLVTAGEAGPGMAEQERAGIEERAAGCRSVMKRSGQHGGDADLVVLLFERPVGRAEAADEFARAPAGAGRDRAPPRAAKLDFVLHWRLIAIFPKRGDAMRGISARAGREVFPD
ncbi:MAG: hypothetical protein ACREE5_14490 [Acetobacteraceae bacterium]